MFATTINKKAYNRIPETVHEITLGQYVDLKGVSELQQLGIIIANNKYEFTGAEYSPQMERQLTSVNTMLKGLDASISEFISSTEKVQIPSTVTLLETIIEVPKDIWPEPYGARMHAKRILLEIKDNHEIADSYMQDILAHYLYCPYIKAVTKQPAYYDERRAEDFKEIVRELPLSTAIQLNNFFLLKSKSIYKSRWQNLATQWSLWKHRLAYRFLTNMETLTRWKA